MSRTVRTLLQHAPMLDPETTGSHVYDMFSEDSDLLVCAVVKDDKPLGLVARNAFFLRMADTHGRALFAKRPVTYIMDKTPLMVEGDQLLSRLSRHIVTDRSSALFDGFIITQDGKYAGVGTGVGLMRNIQAESEERNRKLAALAQQLGQARLEAIAANKTKTEFVATMSHEIRTPLSGIMGITQLLHETSLNNEQAHLANAIQSAGDVLMHLLNDVLDLSKIEAGKMELAPHDFELEDLARAATDLWRPRAESKGLSFSVRTESAGCRHLSGDPVRLKQIVFNLISNAIKFTTRGSVDVLLSLTPLTPTRVILRGEVTDTGRGIPSSVRDGLFTSFMQAEPSRLEEQRGTGLGLTICKQLVELMDGTMAYNTEVGQGSQFWFELPLGVGQDPALIQDTVRDAQSRALLAGRSPSILLVEDDLINQEVICGFLQLRNWDCQVCASGEEALIALQESRFDLILMDVRMPGMDGIETTRHIRKLEGEVRSTPILALTANALREEKADCFKAGMDGYVSKPIKRDAFFDEIERVLSSNWRTRNPRLNGAA